MTLDATHDPKRVSWVESANQPGADFPLQNLPFGVFRRNDGGGARIGVAIGTQALDLVTAVAANLIPPELSAVCLEPDLNALMAAGRPAWRALRAAICDLLAADACPPERREAVAGCLVAQTAVRMLVPAQIGDYTDFYASIHHATNVGAMFRPEQPLLPNYKWVPIGYHGRASSIVPSGTPVRRPSGQRKPPGATEPTFGPCEQLDYELELGWLVGPGNKHGAPIPMAQAAGHLFGAVLLNDWSARDVQAWEYQPLGPFLAKSFATTISPWVVTTEALAPFRVAAAARSAGDPRPLPYLADAEDALTGAFDITVEVALRSAGQRAAGGTPHRLAWANARSLYWTPAQLVAHHASNGCNLRPGDLLGTGTISGPEPGSEGSLLELSRRGTKPVTLPGGEARGFLKDGDEVILRAYAERPGAKRIGFGECRGVVVEAVG